MNYDQNSPPTDTDDATALTTVAEPVQQTFAVMDKVSFHAAGINVAWNKLVSGIIEVGHLLQKAKDDLGHGKFKTMFDKLPFGEDTAQALMRIAKHPVLSNPDRGRYLPPHWRTLDLLTRVPAKKLEAWIAGGSITANTQRSSIEELVDTKKAKAKKVPSCPDKAGKHTLHPATDDDLAAAAEAGEIGVIDINEQHTIKCLKSLHQMLTSVVVGLNWEKLFKSHEDLIRDVSSELRGKIKEHEENADFDRAWEEAQKLN